MARVRAYVGLGANVGEAESTLARAVVALAGLPGVRLRRVSRLYATAPVGVADQPEYRNAVVALDVPAGPTPETGALALLLELKRLERSFGRKRRRRWGPRELDLDLLVFGRRRLVVDRPPEGVSLDAVKAASPSGRLLEVPHPEAARRLFVLAPLADVASRLVPPSWSETVESARRRRLTIEGSEAVRPIATWDEATAGWRRLLPPESGDTRTGRMDESAESRPRGAKRPSGS